MKTLTLTIGHNVGDVPTLDTPGICRTFEKATGCTAYTAIPCLGMWQGQAEESTRLEVADLAEDQAARLMDRVPALAAALAQECIMAEVRECAAVFVAAEAETAENAA